MAPKEAPKAKAKSDPKAKPAPKPKKEKRERPEEEEEPRRQGPDFVAHQEAVGKIQDEIDKLQKESFRLRAQIDERSQGKEEFLAAQAAMRAELTVVSGQLNGIQEQKDEIQARLGDKKLENKAMKDEVNKLKKTMSYKSEAEIDERISAIEYKLWTETLLLKDEKNCMQEIKELKKNKPKVSQVSEMQSRIENFDAGDLGEKRKDLNAQMAGLRQKRTEIQKRMAELTAARKAQMGDFGEIAKQWEATSKKMHEGIRDRSKLKDKFGEQKREFQSYLAEQRRIKAEKYAEERKAQQDQWKIKQMEKEVEKLDERPHTNEITLIEQTIKFCQGLLPQDSAAKQEEKKEIVHNNKADEVVLLKKEDRSEEWLFTPLKKAKATKKSNKASEAEPSKKPIKHNAETFKLFDTLKLDAPITVADIPPLLEKLNMQMERYQAKVKDWQENKEELKRKIKEGIATFEQACAKAEEKKEEKAEEKEEEEEEKEKEAEKEEK